jgi:alpha-methylacyl-CoA racemase
MAARGVFVERHGVTQPGAAPRFSRTVSAIREPVMAEIGDLIGEWTSGR